MSHILRPSFVDLSIREERKKRNVKNQNRVKSWEEMKSSKHLPICTQYMEHTVCLTKNISILNMSLSYFSLCDCHKNWIIANFLAQKSRVAIMVIILDGNPELGSHM